MRYLLTTVGLAAVAWTAATGAGSADHEELHEGGYADADVSPDRGAPGTVIDVSGTCQFSPDVPATHASVRLGQRQDPWYDTGKNLPVASDGTFQGELVVPVDAPPDDYQLSVTCFADDQAFGVHDFDFEVLAGGPNPNRVDIAPEQGPPGTTIRITGTCMFTPDRPGEEANGYLGGGSPWVRADWEAPIAADGRFDGEVVVPDEASPGDYVLVHQCVADEQHYGERILEFVVTPAETPTSDPTDPATTEHTDSATGGELPDTGGSGTGRPVGLVVLLAGMAAAMAKVRYALSQRRGG